MTKYAKPPKTVDEQVSLLLERGLQGDKDRMARKLAVVNYYRLSGYLHPHKQDDETFQEGTEFQGVWRRYCFDRKMRLILLDAIERVEVAVRARVSYVHAHKYGPFGYIRSDQSLSSFTPQELEDFRSAVKAQTKQSREAFVKHFRSKYTGENGQLPVWMGAEIISFGVLCRFYSGMVKADRQEVASSFKLNERTFGSWIKSLNATRNICAHHGRLYNRGLGMKPTFPANKKKHPEWQEVKAGKDRLFGTLTMLCYLMSKIAPKSQWKYRVAALLDEYSDVPQGEMGFVDRWKATRLWMLDDNGSSDSSRETHPPE